MRVESLREESHRRAENIDVPTKSTVLRLQPSNLRQLLSRDTTRLDTIDLGLHDPPADSLTAHTNLLASATDAAVKDGYSLK
ncbi:hypothetical protein [Glaciihabitans sp. UYNi722]|uniref:hypothetical protein n=1 Tax=Glaciihabitans sp. UYNi722 TaxID=3156344 RepID=UPI0033912BE2